ncbi:hypothetical protein MKW98_009995 [Papaver atlanticum]|uniref:Gnk2-homologous domain-containing protein n=1 Tax=Papaver atlanticum TaxID=357466 RepID=A0AAD4RX99_9MAGN|nr:hypothetical protein MKW98_009995 [Papaver atlanticum]
MSGRTGFPAIKYRLLFFVSLIALTHVPTLADPPYVNCSSSGNNTVSDTDIKFQTVRNDLFRILSSKASISWFYNTTVGGDNDHQLYGNFLCLGHFSPTKCQDCVTRAAQDINEPCRTRKQAIVWEEDCQLRYSDEPFFGTMDDGALNLHFWNKKNVTDLHLFRHVVKKLMSNLTEEAAFGSARNMLSVGHTDNNSYIETVHGLAQCTTDLSADKCRRCLRIALDQILRCCYFYRGARVYSKSCYLRYELYDFLGTDNPNSPPSQRSRRNVFVAVFVAILVIGIVILGICLYYLVLRKTKHQELSRCITPSGTSREAEFVYRNIQGEDQMKPRDFPLISFLDILTATDNFSESNKLGKGGYGPVFKAWQFWSEGRSLELLDQLLTEESCDTVEFLRHIQVGLLCAQKDPTVRPNMSSVVVMLGSQSLVLPQPQLPAVSVGRFVVPSEQTLDHSQNGLTISAIHPR